MHSGAPSLNGESTAGSRHTRTWPRHQGPHSCDTAFSSRPHLRPTGSSPPGARRGREVCAGCPRGPARRADTAPQWTAAAPQPLPGRAGRTRHTHESRQTWGTKRRKPLLREEHTLPAGSVSLENPHTLGIGVCSYCLSR